MQARWSLPFSLTTNFISDLGNTDCGLQVCSPWHAVMNASFILLGVTILRGALLIPDAFPPGPLRTAGLWLIALAGPGVILVGLFPENGNFAMHRLGAGLNFVCGNVGMMVLGAGMLKRRRATAAFSVALGSIGFLATVLFVKDQYLGLGIGTMERLAAWPLPLWLTVTGVTSAAGGRVPALPGRGGAA